MPRSRHSSPRSAAKPNRNHARQEIIREAARIMAEEGVQDFHVAKLKAAQRLNLPARDLPTNLEIDTAFCEYLRLFHPERAAVEVRLLTAAINAMRFLDRFQPRLVGPILTGNVTRFTNVGLHLIAETPEEIAFFLQDNNIPYEQGERRFRFGGERFAIFPTFRFATHDVEIEVAIFSAENAREAPLSAVDSRPLRRAAIKEVEALNLVRQSSNL